MRNDSQSPTPAHDEDITVSLDAIELYARRLEDRYEERTATLTAVGGILGQVERIRRLIGEVV